MSPKSRERGELGPLKQKKTQRGHLGKSTRLHPWERRGGDAHGGRTRVGEEKEENLSRSGILSESVEFP